MVFTFTRRLISGCFLAFLSFLLTTCFSSKEIAIDDTLKMNSEKLKPKLVAGSFLGPDKACFGNFPTIKFSRTNGKNDTYDSWFLGLS